jgi:hypothetical protein
MVLGQFPDEAEDTIIPLSWVEAAVDREVAGCSGMQKAKIFNCMSDFSERN